jgi:hypothetical protein
VRRWDDDERGHGVADARGLAPGARELVDALEQPDWVAEQPEAHLLPHIEQRCSEPGSRLRLEAATVVEGVLDVTLRWSGGTQREQTEAVWALLGTFVETASYVRGAADGAEPVWELATGMLAPDTAYAPHGHTVRLRIVS